MKNEMKGQRTKDRRNRREMMNIMLGNRRKKENIELIYHYLTIGEPAAPFTVPRPRIRERKT
jgi:hypothetical protein